MREIEKLALSQFDGTWDKMYIAARKVQKERALSSLVEAGGVSAAILTEKGNIYVGVCIDTACSLGMCAERNAIANMITNGEHRIRRVIAVDRSGKVIPPLWHLQRIYDTAYARKLSFHRNYAGL